ncbi:MAG: RnfABCDGE type electron transport complex subunit D [Bacilli bacterium]|nr:RnfABCDGE type electron transport complex subunit D [Bacilli bacterium]
MSRVYLHSKNNVDSLIKVMLYLFIPFALYGFYKNGIKLYANDYISIFSMIKSLLFIGISVLVSYIFSKLNKEKFISFTLLSNIMIALIASPSLSIIFYLIGIIVLNGIQKLVKFNIVPVFMVITIIVDLILKNPIFLNVFESSVDYNYSLFDFLIGKGPGGTGNTLMAMSIVSLIVLILNINYKKQIPIMAFTSYYILAIITSFVTGTLDQSLLLNNNVIFSFIFLSNVSIYTPYSKGACYIYGLALGMLTYLSYFINIDLGVYLVLTILSFVYPLLDRFIVGKNDKHLIEVL